MGTCREENRDEGGCNSASGELQPLHHTRLSHELHFQCQNKITGS
jgi:hypothetical protein